MKCEQASQESPIRRACRLGRHRVGMRYRSGMPCFRGRTSPVMRFFWHSTAERNRSQSETRNRLCEGHMPRSFKLTHGAAGVFSPRQWLVKPAPTTNANMSWRCRAANRARTPIIFPVDGAMRCIAAFGTFQTFYGFSATYLQRPETEQFRRGRHFPREQR